MRTASKAAIATLATSLLAAGCADQMLGSDRAKDSISGSLGLPAADVTIVDRRADGPTNTNFLIDTRANGRFVCTINGKRPVPTCRQRRSFCGAPDDSMSGVHGRWVTGNNSGKPMSTHVG